MTQVKQLESLRNSEQLNSVSPSLYSHRNILSLVRKTFTLNFSRSRKYSIKHFYLTIELPAECINVNFLTFQFHQTPDSIFFIFFQSSLMNHLYLYFQACYLGQTMSLIFSFSFTQKNVQPSSSGLYRRHIPSVVERWHINVITSFLLPLICASHTLLLCSWFFSGTRYQLIVYSFINPVICSVSDVVDLRKLCTKLGSDTDVGITKALTYEYLKQTKTNVRVQAPETYEVQV